MRRVREPSAHTPRQVHSIRWFYDVLLEKMGGGVLNPASTSTFKKLMKALSFLMGQRRAYVPKAITREVVEALCGIVRVEDIEEMQAASLLVGDLVWGARAADLYLTDWAEFVFELDKEARTEAARVIGLTWRRLQTKNDRLGRKDAPKPLQCCSGCDGTIKVTEDGHLDGIPCPVHLLLEVKAMQARAVKVAPHELAGPVWGSYVLPMSKTAGVKDGANVAAVDVQAMRARVAPTVKVISAKEEQQGVRYDGSYATATPAMKKLKKLPRVQGTFFEVPVLASGRVPDKTYVTRAWADAKGTTASLRRLLHKETANAKKAGKRPAVDDPREYSSRSYRSGCATALKDLPADVRMDQLDHSSLAVSNGYVQRHSPFKKDAINRSDVALSGTAPTEEQTMRFAHELVMQKDGENVQLREENARLRAALGMQTASEASLDERLRGVLKAAMARPGERVPAAVPPAATGVTAIVTAAATPAAGTKRGAEAVVQSSPKKDKPCTPACEAAGLIMRQDWRAQQQTVEVCIQECCSTGSLLTPTRLQAALCQKHVHTRYKAVEGLLTRHRKKGRA